MNSSRLRLALVLSLGMTGIWTGCRGPSPHSSTVSGAAPAETSVRPGINAEYLKPDVDAKQWIQRLEREEREIYRERETIARTVGIKPGADLADIGTGTGIFLPYFSAAAGPKGLVYAVDIVPSFLELVEERNQKAGRRNVVTVLCSERSVELPENSIDLAFICDVYHHFEYPKSSLASIHQALRSGGEIVLVEFKRVPGESSDWILKHVRAGQEVFTSEIESAGFKKVADYPILKDNYMLRFRKTGS
jgi:SAM-dependent methyltransferase